MAQVQADTVYNEVENSKLNNYCDRNKQHILSHTNLGWWIIEYY